MGLFSTKKTIVVSSTIYNMAGPDEDRANFLKSSVFSAVMSPHDVGIGETVVSNHLVGPGIKQRGFFNWAVRNGYAGLPTLSMSQTKQVDTATVAPHIPKPATPEGLQLQVDQAFIANGDFSVFAEQYMLKNHPSLVLTNWTSDYNKTTHEITIQFADGTTTIFAAGDYNPNKRFVVAEYYHYLPEEPQPVVQGTKVIGETNQAALPDGTGFTRDSLTNDVVESFTLNYTKTVTKSYSDGRPDETTTTTEAEAASFQTTHEIRSKTEYTGNNGSSVETKKLKTIQNIWERRYEVQKITSTSSQETLADGTVVTTTTTKDGDHLAPIWDHRTDTQELVQSKIVGGEQIYTYRIGSGNVDLDALETSVATGVTQPEYFPFIPVRLNNVSITAPVHKNSGLYDASETAYRRASGGGQTFSQLIDEVEANQSLNEIDYAYVQYGASLNTKDDAMKRYIYEFFRKLIPYQNTTSTYFTDYQTTVGAYESEITDYKAWLSAQNTKADPLWGTPQPAFPKLDAPRTSTIQLKTDNTATQDSDMRITWVSIDEQIFTGTGKTGAKKGDVWLEVGNDFLWNTYSVRSREISSRSNKMETLKIYWQTDDSNYKMLTIYGAVHQNFIYGGKSVDITPKEALTDLETSGFLLPLHMPTIREMSLVDSTQMATGNTYLVFNSYKVYKKRWYETFLGMVLIVITVVVVAAIFAPAAVGGMAGAFGTNAAVGGALGLTGTGAVVAGAVANALAAIVISTAIMEASTAVFGEKWGAIIGSILSFAVSFGMAGGFSNLSTLMSPQNLLQFSSALANGYNGFVMADIAETQQTMASRAETYRSQMEDLNKMIRELGGGNDLSFNPLSLTDSSAGNGSEEGSYVPETLDEFIHRTTMTGSDIVDVTHSLIGSYAEMNLQLPES